MRPAVLAAVLSATGCFPEEQLRPPRDASVDARRDLPAPSDLGDDAASALDAVVPLDVQLPDVVAPSDAGLDDVPMVPVDADLCAMVPSAMVPAMTVFTDLTRVRDLAFDGRGALAVAAGDRITLVQRGGTTSPLVMSPAGDVTALRFTASGQVVFAASALTDGGTVTGAIFVVDPNAPGAMPTRRFGPTGRVNGLAVHPDGTVYFSDTGASTVWRLALGETTAPTRVATVSAARSLAFDGAGRTLFVGSASGVFRVSLEPAADGGLAAPVQVFGGLDTVTGLATDQCGNLWVSDERPSPATSRIWRVGAGPEFPVVYESAEGVRGLAFGQGGAFDDRVLHFYQERAGAVRAVGIVARGVPRPAASP